MDEPGSRAEERGDERLRAHLAALARLTSEEHVPAAERLQRELGEELAHTLVFALRGGGRRRCGVDAAA
jgi:hypothetical protein